MSAPQLRHRLSLRALAPDDVSAMKDAIKSILSNSGQPELANFKAQPAAAAALSILADLLVEEAVFRCASLAAGSDGEASPNAGAVVTETAKAGEGGASVLTVDMLQRVLPQLLLDFC